MQGNKKLIVYVITYWPKKYLVPQEIESPKG